MQGKIFLQALAIFFVIVGTTVAHAEVQTYTGVGEYFMAEDTTVDFAKYQASISAERDALEQVKVYVRSQSKMIDGKIDDDDIIAIGAGILCVKDTKFSIEDTAQGLLVKAIVTAEIDIDELETLLEREINARTSERRN